MEKSYSSKDRYDKFNLLNNRTQKKDYYAVIVPDYVTVTYDFIMSTYYIEQLNKIIEDMNYASDSYWGDPEKFKFRARIDSFNTPSEVENGQERSIKCNFQLKLYGYIIPKNIQREILGIKKYSNKNKIVFDIEVVFK